MRSVGRENRPEVPASFVRVSCEFGRGCRPSPSLSFSSSRPGPARPSERRGLARDARSLRPRSHWRGAPRRRTCTLPPSLQAGRQRVSPASRPRRIGTRGQAQTKQRRKVVIDVARHHRVGATWVRLRVMLSMTRHGARARHRRRGRRNPPRSAGPSAAPPPPAPPPPPFARRAARHAAPPRAP